jgi:hypothetical protein
MDLETNMQLTGLSLLNRRYVTKYTTPRAIPSIMASTLTIILFFLTFEKEWSKSTIYIIIPILSFRNFDSIVDCSLSALLAATFSLLLMLSDVSLVNIPPGRASAIDSSLECVLHNTTLKSWPRCARANTIRRALKVKFSCSQQYGSMMVVLRLSQVQLEAQRGLACQLLVIYNEIEPTLKKSKNSSRFRKRTPICSIAYRYCTQPVSSTERDSPASFSFWAICLNRAAISGLYIFFDSLETNFLRPYFPHKGKRWKFSVHRALSGLSIEWQRL